MDFKEIKELIELVAEKRLAEFEMEKGGFKLRIRHFDGSPSPTATIAPSVIIPAPAIPYIAAPATPHPPPPAQETTSPAAEMKAVKELHKIKAPIVGTFYRSPSPTADPFVKVGSQVKSGSVLCIIEAMKLMNEIEADVYGEVVEIYVDNGQPVEYGQPLFGIKID